MAMLEQLGTIRLRDLEVFVEVARARSIREIARRLHTTPGQISKIIQNLESRLNTKLFRRSVSGVLLTHQGTELRELVQELLINGEKIENLLAGRGKAKMTKTLAIAGTSFLNTHFTIPSVCKDQEELGDVVFRFMDLAPDQIVSTGLRGGFEMSVHFGSISWPSTWVARNLGETRWVLCAKANHPLPRRSTLSQVLEYPFVIPIYWTQEGLVRGNDQFPIAVGKRKSSFEASTADAAVPIIMQSEHLAYLPYLAIQPFLADKRLKEIVVSEVPAVKRELFLSAKSDMVPAKTFEVLVKRMSERLLPKAQK